MFSRNQIQDSLAVAYDESVNVVLKQQFLVDE